MLGLVLPSTYMGLCVAARFVYPRMLFPAPRLEAVPGQVARAIATGTPELLELPQPAGGATRALFWAPKERARVAVLFHGNGETMFDSVDLAERLVRRGLGAMLVEYRGYGLTHGPPPEEEAMYADAEAALAYLAARGLGAERVAIWGTSLGTGVASEMARRGRGARLVLVAPFTSVVAMGKRFAWFLPMGAIMKHRFDTLAKAGDVRVPTLVVHGDRDELIPVAMGEAVADAIPGARLLRVAGGHHNDLYASVNVLDEILAHVAAP